MDICCRCLKIPFQDLFGTKRGPRHWLIGDLNHARRNRSVCRFCFFLVEAYELAYDLPQGLLAEGNKNPRLGFQILARAKHGADDGEEPWSERMGIAVDGPQVGPALWLRFDGVERNRLELGPPFVCISCSPAQQQPGKSTMLLPRQRALDEVVNGKLNYTMVKEWLRICLEEHDGLCRRGTAFQRKKVHSRLKFRLIDVNRRKVVVAREDMRYLALSYVWGKVMKEEAASFWSNEAFNVGLIELPPRVPRTIEDAITFAKRIGCKYLWVDAYCINQLDQNDLRNQINHMHLVFECAFLTIAAMDGEDPNAGLCGISRSFKQLRQPHTEIAYGNFMATYVDEVWSSQGQSHWETRAWTLQEFLLSTRVLFFGQYYMTMRCNSEIFQDLLEVDGNNMRPRFQQSSTYFWENGFSVRLYDEEWSFLNYDIFLANYTCRKLQHRDILSACQGAFNQITENTGVGFLQGLPKADLHLGLLWKPHHQDALTKRSGFPSWSFTGWIGRVEHHYCLDDLRGYEEMGINKREEQMEKSMICLTIEEQEIINNETASISIEDDNVLQIFSQVARTTVIRVRQKGDKVKGQMKGSDQSPRAVGDHWVLLDRTKKPLPNEVGEVARFECTDYSFQIDPTISTELERTGGQCELLFIQYFPSLRDCLRKEKETWLFDYVGCLVILRSGNYHARVGFVFIKLKDWAVLDRQIKAINLV